MDALTICVTLVRTNERHHFLFRLCSQPLPPPAQKEREICFKVWFTWSRHPPGASGASAAAQPLLPATPFPVCSSSWRWRWVLIRAALPAASGWTCAFEPCRSAHGVGEGGGTRAQRVTGKLGYATRFLARSGSRRHVGEENLEHLTLG